MKKTPNLNTKPNRISKMKTLKTSYIIIYSILFGIVSFFVAKKFNFIELNNFAITITMILAYYGGIRLFERILNYYEKNNKSLSR